MSILACRPVAVIDLHFREHQGVSARCVSSLITQLENIMANPGVPLRSPVPMS
jgi:hypothetical protein